MPNVEDNLRATIAEIDEVIIAIDGLVEFDGEARILFAKLLASSRARARADGATMELGRKANPITYEVEK